MYGVNVKTRGSVSFCPCVGRQSQLRITPSRIAPSPPHAISTSSRRGLIAFSRANCIDGPAVTKWRNKFPARWSFVSDAFKSPQSVGSFWRDKVMQSPGRSTF